MGGHGRPRGRGGRARSGLKTQATRSSVGRSIVSASSCSLRPSPENMAKSSDKQSALG